MTTHFVCKKLEELDNLTLFKILQLRQEVFIVEQDCPYLDADEKDLQALHLIGYDEAQNICCYARILAKGISYPGYASIGRVITKIEKRKSGLGSTLMKEAIKVCESIYPNQKIKISAQTHLAEFYQKLGFELTGENYLEDNIPHSAMIYKSS